MHQCGSRVNQRRGVVLALPPLWDHPAERHLRRLLIVRRAVTLLMWTADRLCKGRLFFLPFFPAGVHSATHRGQCGITILSWKCWSSLSSLRQNKKAGSEPHTADGEITHLNGALCLKSTHNISCPGRVNLSSAVLSPVQGVCLFFTCTHFHRVAG